MTRTLNNKVFCVVSNVYLFPVNFVDIAIQFVNFKQTVEGAHTAPSQIIVLQFFVCFQHSSLIAGYTANTYMQRHSVQEPGAGVVQSILFFDARSIVMADNNFRCLHVLVQRSCKLLCRKS